MTCSRRSSGAVRATIGGLALIVGLSGCQKVSRSVSSSVSPCFRILPEAHAAVGSQGTFVDVARIRGRAVSDFDDNQTGETLPARGFGLGPVPTSPPTTMPTTTPGTTPAASTTTGASGVAKLRRDVCVVAYKGTFVATRIQHLIGIEHMGRYAIVVVSVRTRMVRAVVLRERLPAPLHGH